MNAEIVSRLELSFDLESELEVVNARLEELDEAARVADKRFDALEDRVWRLMERAGLHNPNDRD